MHSNCIVGELDTELLALLLDDVDLLVTKQEDVEDVEDDEEQDEDEMDE